MPSLGEAGLLGSDARLLGLLSLGPGGGPVPGPRGTQGSPHSALARPRDPTCDWDEAREGGPDARPPQARAGTNADALARGDPNLGGVPRALREVAHGGQLVKENMMATADAVEDLRDALPAEFDAFARGGDGALDDMPSPLVSADSFAGLLDGAERLKLSPSNLTAVAEAPANMNAAGQEDAAVLGTGPPLPPPVAGAVEKKPKRVVHRRDPDKRREQNRAASRRYRERARLRDALGSAARFAAAASTNVDTSR